MPAETVALAMARVYGFQVPTPEQPVIQPSPGRRAIVAGAIAIVIFNGVAGFFAVSNGIDGTGFTVFAAVLLAELVVGLVLVATRFRRAGFALLWGILSSFGLVAIAFCLFLGYCLVEYSNL